MSSPQTDPSINRIEHDTTIDSKKVSLWTLDDTGSPSRVGSGSGLPTSSAALATRTDSATTTNVTYVGKAAIGSLTSAAAWQIFKMDETTTNTLVITWAGGSSAFNQIWDNRASSGYS